MKTFCFLFLSSLFFRYTFSYNKAYKNNYEKVGMNYTKNININVQCNKKKKIILKKWVEDVFIGKKHGWKLFCKDSRGKLELNLSHKSLLLHGLIGSMSATQAYALYDIINRIRPNMLIYKHKKEAMEVNEGDRLNEAYENIKNLDYYHFFVESIASVLSGRITMPLFRKIFGMNIPDKMRAIRSWFFK
jgi:hypothetical protein